MDAASVWQWIVVFGLGLVVAAGLLSLLAKAGLPLGRLPSDIPVAREHSSFHVPIVTCLVASAVLTVLLNLVLWLLRK